MHFIHVRGQKLRKFKEKKQCKRNTPLTSKILHHFPGALASPMLKEMLPEILPSVSGEGVYDKEFLVEDVSYRFTPKMRVNLSSLGKKLA